jgi:DNA-binding FadR family transcriptional regulator
LEAEAQDSRKARLSRLRFFSSLSCNHSDSWILLSKVESEADDYYAAKEDRQLMLRARRYPRRGAHGETVYEIGRRIVGGELKPGDLLPEGELIAELDISRTVLREAIKVLGAKGLVEARPRIGTKVSPRSHWRLMDPDVLAWQTEYGFDELFLRNLAEVRSLIEPGAARLAAERASEEEIAILD